MQNERFTLDYWKQQLDELWLSNIRYVHKGKDVDRIIQYAYMDLISDPDRIETATASDFKRLVNSWLSNRKPEQIKGKRDISKL